MATEISKRFVKFMLHGKCLDYRRVTELRGQLRGQLREYIDACRLRLLIQVAY